MMEPNVHELIIPAQVDKLSTLLSFVDTLLKDSGCPLKVQMQIDVTLEELFVNIAHYAYQKDGGKANIRVKITSKYAEITLIDNGIPYNPLQKPDPDITLSAQERSIGGLGIFMSKKFMDEISYKHCDSKNILTIKKFF